MAKPSSAKTQELQQARAALVQAAAPGTETSVDERPYQPFGGALELFRSRAREVLLAGPAGTGKSRACLEKLNLIAMQKPIRAAIVRKTRKSLTQSAMTTFEDKVLPQPSSVRFHEGDQEYRYPSGARIMVAGLDDSDKIGSTEFDIVYVQEATELDEDDWGMLLRGLRNGVLSYQQLIADCNPSTPDHWLKQRCNSGQTLLLDSRHEDNPLLVSPETGDYTEFGRGYMATLDSLQGYLYQRLRLGQWVAAEGMYFTEWDPAQHLCPRFDIPEDWPRWLSVDYGFADRRGQRGREDLAEGARPEHVQSQDRAAAAQHRRRVLDQRCAARLAGLQQPQAGLGRRAARPGARSGRPVGAAAAGAGRRRPEPGAHAAVAGRRPARSRGRRRQHSRHQDRGPRPGRAALRAGRRGPAAAADRAHPAEVWMIRAESSGAS